MLTCRQVCEPLFWNSLRSAARGFYSIGPECIGVTKHLSQRTWAEEKKTKESSWVLWWISKCFDKGGVSHQRLC